MKVTLIGWTGKEAYSEEYGYDQYGQAAVDILLFTKNTRLVMTPGALEEIASKPYHAKLEELQYMANTIPSSWEFIDYTWMIEGVSRAFTHQFVRSRQFSFAQQTHRILDMSEGPGWDYLTGPSLQDHTIQHVDEFDSSILSAKTLYDAEMSSIASTYKALIDAGVPIEDARGILPTNILTNIVAKCNMRTFVELVRKRSSARVQGEYRDVLVAMQKAVLKVHPWMSIFIDRTADRAANELQEMIIKYTQDDHGEGENVTTQMIKLLDQIRSASE